MKFWKRQRSRRRGYVPLVERIAIFERDRWLCRYCGRRCKPPGSAPTNAHPMLATVDHVIPKARGGITHRDNLVTACYQCNQAKRDREIGEALPRDWEPAWSVKKKTPPTVTESGALPVVTEITTNDGDTPKDADQVAGASVDGDGASGAGAAVEGCSSGG